VVHVKVPLCSKTVARISVHPKASGLQRFTKSKSAVGLATTNNVNQCGFLY